jgi:Secretion system C-terminal sorting domain/PKD domain
MKCGTFEFSALPNNPTDYTYAWNFGTYPGAVSSVPNPEYSYHNDGNYTVALVITEISTGIVHTVTKDIKISCYPNKTCDPPFNDENDYYTISGLFTTDQNNSQHGPFSWSVFAAQNGLNPNTQTLKKFFIRGTLIIDKPVTFDRCEWIMDEGAKIEVNYTGLGNVLFSRGKLEGCAQMWRGVYCDSRALYMEGVTIRDAENGLRLSGTARANLTNNKFYNNAIGIKCVVNANPIRTCIGNEFKKDGPFKTNYVGQVEVPNNDKPNFGIYASGCNAVNVNGSSISKNYFSEMNNGVYVTNGNASITQNEFSNISGSSIALASSTRVNFVQNNKITNGGWGVEITNPRSNTSIEISNNTEFSGLSFGIEARGGADCSINIHNNQKIKNNNTGISINNMNVPKRVSIVDNEGTVAEPAFQFNKNSIVINKVAGIYQCEILRNRIRTHDFFQSKGIEMTDCNAGWDINNNNILIGNVTTQSESASTGIDIKTSSSNIFDGNIVSGAGVSKDISSSASADNTLNCNTTQNGKVGFEFFNNNLHTLFKANQINDVTDAGLKLSNALVNGVIVNGQIDAQSYRGNTWKGSNSSAKMDNGTQIGPNKFIYNPSLTNPVPPAGAAWKPGITQQNGMDINGWFEDDNEKSNSTCLYNTNGTTSQNLVTELEAIVNGNVPVNQYFDQNRWTAQIQLLHMLEYNASLRTISPTIANFYNSALPVKLYFEKQKALETIFLPTSAESAQLLALDQQIQGYQTELDQLILLGESDAATHELPIVNKMNEIKQVHSNILLINDNIQQRGMSNAQLLKTEITSLAEPFVFCTKHKQTLLASIDFVLLGESYVNSNYGAILKSIAEECEFDIGNPVYYAQALCRQLSIPFDEGLHCAENRSRIENKANNISDLWIYPNPASSTLTVNLYLPFKNVTIYDITGKKQLSFNFDEFINSREVEINNFKNGVYLINVLDVNNDVHISKFIKI